LVQCKKEVKMILAGDIGGTNTRLALFENSKQIGEEKKFPSKNYSHLEAIIKEFLGEKRVDKACFGIAGPICDQVCKATNLPWVIDAEHIQKNLNIPFVHLLNDLEANAYGLKVLEKKDLYLLNQGREQKGNQALISAGTGLGQAGLYWDGKDYQPFPCEGGHTDFGPRDGDEIELFLYLQKKFGHVSYERVISGPGLVNIFEFLIDSKREKLAPELKQEMDKGSPAKVISEWAVSGKDKACVRAVDWFISLYGAEAGNLALKFLALGGVYIGGGIAPRLVEKMKMGSFLSSFLSKGRFNKLLESIPIWVVLNDRTALLGAAYYVENR